MSNRKDNIKKSLGFRKFLWSSDDDDSDSQTEGPVYRRPNTDPNLHTESTGDLGTHNSTSSLDRRAATKLERDRFFRMLNSPMRVPPCGPILGSSHNIPSEIYDDCNAGHYRAVDMRKILSIQKVRRRGERSLPSSTNFMQNIEGMNRSEPARVLMPTLTASNIIPAMLERARSMEDPQPSTSQSTVAAVIRNGLFSLISDPYPNDESSPEQTSPSAPNNAPDAEMENVDAGAAPRVKVEATAEREAEAEQGEGREAEQGEGREAEQVEGREGEQDGEEEIDVGDEEGPRPSTSAENNAQAVVLVADRQRASQSQAAGKAPPRKRRRESQESSYIPYTVQEFNQCLLRLLECPVCLEWMEPPMSQCRRGHLVCNRCRARLSACPVCRISFSSVRNRAMEGVAELLHYPCRHGCGRGPRLRRRESHEANCAARRYACFAPDCADRPLLPLKELYVHMRGKHPTMVKVGRSQRFSVKTNSEVRETWLVCADGELFQLRVDLDIRTCGLVVHLTYVGPKCKASNFTYQVTVEGRHDRKIVYCRQAHSDMENTSLAISRQDCFYLGPKQVGNFLRVENHNQLEKFVDFCVEVSRTTPETPNAIHTENTA